MSFRIKFLICSIVITLVTMVFCFSVVSTPQKVFSAPSSNNEKVYTLKEFNGKLAIYESTQNSPIEILDVYISSLPERDAQKIKNGISADSLNKIYEIAEDYE